MKKSYLIIFILIIILISSLMGINSALAETKTINIEIISNNDLYYNFESPKNISFYKGNFALKDENKIKTFIDGVENSFEFEYEIKDFYLFKNYIFILYTDSDTNYFKVYNSSGKVITTCLDDVKIKSLTLDANSNNLYYLASMKLYKFNIVIDDNLSLSNAVENDGIFYDIAGNNKLDTTSKIVMLKRNIGLLNGNNFYLMDIESKEVTNIINNLDANLRKVSANENCAIFYRNDTNNSLVAYNIEKDSADENESYVAKIIPTNQLFNNDISTIGGISIDSNKLYISDTSNQAIKRYVLTSTEITYDNQYSSYGKSEKHLYNPQCVSFANDKLYIADKKNNRIVVYDYKENSISNTQTIGKSGSNDGDFIEPKVIKTDFKNGFYVVDKTNKIQYFKDNKFSKSYKLEDTSEITSLAISGNGTIYATDINSNKIYYKTSNMTKFEIFVSLKANPKHLTTSKYGKILYVAFDTGVKAYTPQGIELEISFEYSDLDINAEGKNEIKDIIVDYIGNLYLLNDNSIICLSRQVKNYIKLNTLSFNDLVISPNSLTADNSGNIYLANTGKHTLAKINASDTNFVIEKQNQFEAPLEYFNPARICYIKENITMYHTPNNYEDIETLLKDQYVLVYQEVEFNTNKYFYIEYKDKKAYIQINEKIKLLPYPKKAPFDLAKPLHQLNDKNNKNLSTLDIYAYPSYNAEKLYENISLSEKFKVTSNIALHDELEVWDFYQIEYKNKVGYVLKTDIMPTKMPTVKPQQFFAKIRSSKLAEKVPIYAIPDTHSAVIIELKDSTKVEMNTPIDSNEEFMLIKYGDKIGYVKTENLVASGLTTGQILTIILAGLTFTSTVAVILISKTIKKNSMQ